MLNDKQLFLEHLESLERSLSAMLQWTKQTKKNLLFSMTEASKEEGEGKRSDPS